MKHGKRLRHFCCSRYDCFRAGFPSGTYAVLRQENHWYYNKQLQEKEDTIKSLKISNYDYFCKLTQQNKVVDDIDITDDKDDKEEFETLDDLLKEEFK